MSFSWDLIKSMQIKFYNLNDKSLLPGNKVCSNVISKQAYLIDINDSTPCRDEFICTSMGCNTRLESLTELEAHQKARHTYYCSVCSLTLPSHHLLDCHLLENHDSFFHILSQKQPMFACFLESCKLLFQTEEERKDHCISKHSFPNDFRFDLKWRKLPRYKKTSNKSNIKSTSPNNFCPDNMNKNSCHQTEEMDYTLSEDSLLCNSSPITNSNSKNKGSKIPQVFSFGIGVPRAFNRTSCSKNKHWHQKEKTHKTRTKIETISLNDMNEALEDMNVETNVTLGDVRIGCDEILEE